MSKAQYVLERCVKKAQTAIPLRAVGQTWSLGMLYGNLEFVEKSTRNAMFAVFAELTKYAK